ncbi:hypothetical protein TRFO_38020 [Tritrichomonas foetus]|uniref:Uncharacterized protein n=1 Tax=Tritrichomonas foetus TaxID=1144522 RepID=A0A1J4JEZ9_9EUKA|nr:hypothetical protein TRFO_38020 [Tritrichomonas foetus]|eukprot:OHS95836.1 hypothetical protein TRFO_38020 [Tritrichomonas foetus]
MDDSKRIKKANETTQEVVKDTNLTIPVSLSCHSKPSGPLPIETRTYMEITAKSSKSENKSHLYVHFEGEHPYCILLKSPHFKGVKVFIIGDFALDEYNTKFGTDYLFHEVRYFLVNDITNKYDEIAALDLFIYEPNTELVIRLPDPAKEELNLISLKKEKKFVDKGWNYYKHGDPKTAATYFWSAGVQGIPHLVKLTKQTGDQEMLERIKLMLLTRYPDEIQLIASLFQIQSPKDIHDAMEQLENPKKLSTNQRRDLIKYVSKTQPYIALKICLRFPEYIQFLPIPCKTEEIMTAFVQICTNLGYTNSLLVYLSEIFVKYGQISHALALGYNASVLADCPDSVTRRACWIMLIDKQFSSLYMTLVAYFNKDQNRSIGGLNASIILSRLTAIKRFPPIKARTACRVMQTIVDPLDPDDLDFLCIVLITASFLFLNGNIDEYIDVSAAINSQNRKFFEKTGIPQEFDLFVYIDKAGEFAINDRPKTESVFAIGDEGSLGNAYNTLATFEMVISHPIPRLTIWDLRRGVKKFKKAAFWHQICESILYKHVLLVLGHYDLLYIVPKLLQYDFSIETVNDAINRIVEIYLYVIQKIHKKMPQLEIYIHPVKIDNKMLIPQAEIFNAVLKKALPEYAIILSESDCMPSYDDSSMVPLRTSR